MSALQSIGSVFSVALVSGALLLLPACASAPEQSQQDDLPSISREGHEGVRARLDMGTATAVTPISDYLSSSDFETDVLYARAGRALAAACMAETGYDYAGDRAVDWGRLQLQEDRRYGQWDRAAAAKYGFDLDRGRGIPKGTGVEQGQAFTDALAACTDWERAENSGLGKIAEALQRPTIADRISDQSSYLAEVSSEGKAATKKYAACMEAKSIVTDPESGYASAEYHDLGQAEMIAAAVAEAECNVSTGRIETLYNVKAQYEAAYIEKYEAQLAEALKDKRTMQDELRAIIDGAK